MNDETEGNDIVYCIDCAREYGVTLRMVELYGGGIWYNGRSLYCADCGAVVSITDDSEAICDSWDGADTQT